MNPEEAAGYQILAFPVLGRDAMAPEQTELLMDRFRILRLTALQNAPNAYASSYDIDKEKPRDFWVQRLSNPLARHFIAVPILGQQVLGISDTLDAEWCGLIAMIGPSFDDTKGAVAANQSPFASKSTASQPITLNEGKADELAASQTARYHLASMFTSPNHRRRGIGKALLNCALSVAEEDCRKQGTTLCVDIHADTDNPAAINLYEAAGFSKIAVEIYQPAPVAAGPRPEKKAHLMELTRSFR
ncbi:hypothetical protein ANO11243_015790 [Dothideomycetidae sp. 11243]|nr:hypothetical protein ANO11243_015790 [fungal sp. No.11243]